MCRLYGFRATHPTGVECELIEAQNSLMRQSQRDERGLDSPDGWGLGTVRDGVLRCERKVGPAHASLDYRRGAASTEATTVIAHVRRATVGRLREENTHPFRHGRSMLAHNGHVPAFEDVRPRLLEEIPPASREAIRGSTDSEHLFHLLLSRLGARVGTEDAGELTDADPELMRNVLREAILDVEAWCERAAPERTEIPRGPDGRRLDRVALNVLWTIGDRLVGSRVGRSLWRLERSGAHRCEVCGERHPDPEPAGYRSVVVASERITREEEWEEVPESSVFLVDDDMRLRAEPVRP